MAGFSIEISNYRRVPVIRVVGEIDFSTQKRLEEAGEQVEYSPIIIVDLIGTQYLDSIAVRWLFSWKEKHGDIIMVAAQDNRIIRVIDMSGLLPFFMFFDSIDEIKKVIDRLFEFIKNRE